MEGGDEGARDLEILGGAERMVWLIFWHEVGDVGQEWMALYVVVSTFNFIHWAFGSQWRDWQRGGTERRPVEELAEKGGGHCVGTNGGIGREGWRTLSGDQWRDWQRGVGGTEWKPVEGLAEGWRTLSGDQWRDWQRGVEDTERKPVEGLAERGGGH
ncbi:unnamed protein product [Staurois parvus]|uniref:Uncharacterized protein n=1 Tax=Staurois parvus TaxID=386267 RepID=A0ABN9EVN7_9NEOB|nr:unnamed protein product [Staurois parvus]